LISNLLRMEKYDEGLKVIALALKEEESGQNKSAYEQYVAGIAILLEKLKTETKDDVKAMVKKHISRFMDAAEASKAKMSQSSESQALRKARETEGKARSYEKTLKLQLAFNAYTEAAEQYRSYRLQCDADTDEHRSAGESALAMIVRAESLKRVLSGYTPEAASSTPVRNEVAQVEKSGGLPSNLVAAFVRPDSVSSEEEKRVLLMGSKIYGKTYELMYPKDADWCEFEGTEWRDPDGLLKLCPKQKAAGAVWGRPRMFLDEPVLISRLVPESITQTLIGDCSFVSSLALCAAWEHRFKRTLISQNIYPQVRPHLISSASTPSCAVLARGLGAPRRLPPRLRRCSTDSDTHRRLAAGQRPPGHFAVGPVRAPPDLRPVRKRPEQQREERSLRSAVCVPVAPQQHREAAVSSGRAEWCAVAVIWTRNGLGMDSEWTRSFTRLQSTGRGRAGGRYVVKLLLNGAVRKVAVDDFLPVTPTRPVQLLCTYSRAGELWVSLFEKAYLKVHGGSRPPPSPLMHPFLVPGPGHGRASVAVTKPSRRVSRPLWCSTVSEHPARGGAGAGPHAPPLIRCPCACAIRPACRPVPALAGVPARLHGRPAAPRRDDAVTAASVT
jgi:hypothetical protein